MYLRLYLILFTQIINHFKIKIMRPIPCRFSFKKLSFFLFFLINILVSHAQKVTIIKPSDSHINGPQVMDSTTYSEIKIKHRLRN